MATSSVIYKGGLRTLMTHLDSGNQVVTDAPKDNHGNGEYFSPTDLMATSLAACMLTTMGIKAMQMGIELKGTKASVTKVMASDPRRIARIEVIIEFPDLELDEKSQVILRNTAERCPVAVSLHPDVEQVVEFRF